MWHSKFPGSPVDVAFRQVSCLIFYPLRALTCEPAHNKFVNFHGQKCARLDADTYVFGEDRWENHIIFKVTNILLFGSLKEHALRLRRVWANHIIIQPRWKDFVTRVTDELSRYTIFVRAVYLLPTTFLTNE